MQRLDTRWTRIATVGLLLVGLGAACVGFATLGPNPAENRYPDGLDVLDDTESYLGERVVVGGRVVGTTPTRVAVDYTTVCDGAVVAGTVEYTVTGVSVAVERGEFVQVFGTLGDTRTVRATNVVRVPSRNFTYMYAVSFLSGLWVLGRLIGGWRVDWGTLGIRPRDRGHGLRAHLGSWLGRENGEDGDA